MKTPVWHLVRERLTDAPLELVLARLTGGALEESRQVWAAEERLVVTAAADPAGTRLRLEATLRGWGGFLRVPAFTWKVDRHLERFVESL